MDLSKLKAKRIKLDEQIRKAKARECEQRERHLLKLAKKHGLLQLEQPALETALARIAVTESEPSFDTVSSMRIPARTPTIDQPETAPEIPKKRWSAP
jgi:hypothetical protein